VIRLRLPPLRERAEDIPLLVRNFLQKSANDLGVEAKRMSDAAMKALCRLPLPGNVRQLENLCHWLTVMAPALIVEVKDLPPELRGPGADSLRTRAPATPLPRQTDASINHSINDRYSEREEAPLEKLAGSAEGWENELERAAEGLLAQGRENVMDELTRNFEATVIRVALRHTGGRRIEAAQRLGIGRNTITRKIQEFGLEDEDPR
jgi:two-component system nitrogen regulation response regulator GlnG